MWEKVVRESIKGPVVAVAKPVVGIAVARAKKMEMNQRRRRG